MNQDEANTIARNIHRYYPNINIEDMSRELIEVSGEFAEIGLHDDNTFHVVTTPITLKDRYKSVELGNIRFYVSYDMRDGWLSKVMFSVGRELVHPHVRDGMLCYGSGGTLCSNLAMEGRFPELLSITNSILHTYNSFSPYHHLVNWYGVQCGACTGKEYKTRMRVCTACKRKLCRGCIIIWDICGKCVFRLLLF